VSVTRITPWAVNGPDTAYGLASSLSGTATNVPAGALIVTSVQSQSTTKPSVSDTAGNVYDVVPGGSDSAHLTAWIAYCLSAKANTANIVKWQAASAVLTGAQGEAATTSVGTWAFDKVVGGYSAYATALALSISTTGAGLIYGGFGEYETGPDTWAITGLTAQASQSGTSTSTGNCGCLLADEITSGPVTSQTETVSDANGGYGGYIAGVLASFVVNAGSTPVALAGSGQQQPGASGQLSVAVPLQAVAIQAQGASGGITVLVPLAGSSTAQQHASGTLSAGVALSGVAVATQQANGSLSISVPLAASSVQQALARSALGVGVPLAGSSTQQQGAPGSLSIHVSLAGEQLQQAIAAATLTNIPAGAVDLAGSSGQQQGASGRLSVGKNLSGATLAIQGASGSLAVGVPLSGASVQASRAGGALAVGVTLSGASLQQALASAALSNVGAIDLSGASTQQQGGAGTLLLQIHLTAEALQQVGAVATLGVSTIPTYHGTGRFYAAAPQLAFYAAPRRAFYAAAPAASYYGSA
jgi:uncharacterized protein YjbI with pentapeptide repeats